MIIKKIDTFDMINGIMDNKPSFTIWFAGCTIKCKGCHNEQLWKFEGGIYTVDDIINILQSKNYKYESVVLTGGEPLDQDPTQIRDLINRLYDMGLKIWLYTGRDMPPLDILDKLFFIKYGRYREDMPSIEGSMLASENQRMLYLYNHKYGGYKNEG